MRHGRTHGMSSTPEFRAWTSMKARCSNPNDASWHRYGGRGIKVCERWNTFASFIEDMGRRPSNEHSIDRIDNDGPYSPDNCRWTTRDVQNSNRSDNVYVQFDGKRRTLTEWAHDVGISVQALCFRLKSSEWTLRDALTIKERRRVRGESHPLAKLTNDQAVEVLRRRRAGEKLQVLADEFGVSPSRISKMTRTHP